MYSILLKKLGKGYFTYIVAIIIIAAPRSTLLSYLLTMVSPIGCTQQHAFAPKTPPCPRMEAAGEEHPGDTESGGGRCRLGACLLSNLKF